MKKVVMLVVATLLTVGVNAASVNWSAATGSPSYANNAYLFFVVGQNGVTDISAVTTLLDSGKSADGLAFGTGTVLGTGAISGSSTTPLSAGTYTSFIVLFDADDKNYVVLSGNANQTKTVADTTAVVTFIAGNVSSTLTNSDNWKPVGVPEPTSGLLLLVGAALMALRRKQK